MQAFCKKNTFLLYKCHKELEECVIYAALKLKIFQIWDPLKRDKKIASSNTLCCGTHFLILESCEIARGLLYLQKILENQNISKLIMQRGSKFQLSDEQQFIQRRERDESQNCYFVKICSSRTCIKHAMGKCQIFVQNMGLWRQWKLFSTITNYTSLF